MITITGTQLTCIASCTAVQSSWELLGPPLKGEVAEVADVGATPGELGASPAVPGGDEEDRYLTVHLCRVVHRVALRAGRTPSVIARADTRLQQASNMVVRGLPSTHLAAANWKNFVMGMWWIGTTCLALLLLLGTRATNSACPYMCMIYCQPCIGVPMDTIWGTGMT